MPAQVMRTIKLPPPTRTAAVSVEEALARRRSVREFAERPLTLAELGQLLWAAQGITAPDGRRTAPSAGALYPLELYAVVGAVEDLASGVYRYRPQGHTLELHIDADVRPALTQAALGQESVADAPVVLAFAAVAERTRVKYRERTERYVHIEVGHAAQNVYLQAVALGLGTVVVGAFHDDEVTRVLRLDRGETPAALMPVGRLR